ncbi:MAG: hypothetical protein DRN66_02090 [Candidatus Nanohalarchaeota archaeon]|nr:MAG: hypothetical protein DRN66_02090 [Candidatus Nanohaloarchaeota archaeon]
MEYDFFGFKHYKIMSYFYFFLGFIDFFIAFFAWSEFKRTGLVLVIAGLVNFYICYLLEMKNRQLFIESIASRIFSYLVIIVITIVYSLLSISKTPLFIFAQTILAVTVYIGIFSLVIFVLIKIGVTKEIFMFFGFSKEHIGIKKVIFLKNERYSLLNDLFAVVDINLVESYVVGDSQKIDNLLREIEDSKNILNSLWTIRFLFISLYEKELAETEKESEKEEIKRTINAIKKQMNY